MCILFLMLLSVVMTFFYEFPTCDVCRAFRVSENLPIAELWLKQEEEVLVKLCCSFISGICIPRLVCALWTR